MMSVMEYMAKKVPLRVPWRVSQVNRFVNNDSPSKITFLMKIPDDVLLAVLSQWIILISFVRLDSAMMTKSGRVMFLNTIRSSPTTFFDHPKNNKYLQRLASNKLFVIWLGLRKIGINTLEMFDEMLDPSTTSAIEMLLLKVEHLIVNCSEPNIRMLNVSHLQNLITLSIEQCDYFRNSGLFALQVFFTNCDSTKLLEIKLNKLNITNATLRSIADHCTALISFELLECNDVTEGGVHYVLQSCTKLENVLLSISHRAPTPQSQDPTLLCINEHCHNLVSLKYTNCYPIHAILINVLFERRVKLKHLSVSGYNIVDVPTAVYNAEQNLQPLPLEYFEIISTCRPNCNSLCHWVARMKNLTSLKINLYLHLSPHSVTVIVENCKKLHTLHIINMGFATPRVSIFSFLLGIELLTDFRLDHCWICDFDIQLFGHLLVNLTALGFSDNFDHEITDASLKVIAKHCCKLVELDVSSCTVTFQGVKSFLSAVPSIRQMYINCSILGNKTSKHNQKLASLHKKYPRVKVII